MKPSRSAKLILLLLLAAVFATGKLVSFFRSAIAADQREYDVRRQAELERKHEESIKHAREDQLAREFEAEYDAAKNRTVTPTR